MDPTHAPDFRPPSTNPPVEPTLPPTLIPNRRPIRPLVLADYPNPLDNPIDPEMSITSAPSNPNSVTKAQAIAASLLPPVTTTASASASASATVQATPASGPSTSLSSSISEKSHNLNQNQNPNPNQIQSQTHESARSHTHSHSHGVKHKIPKQPTELEPFSSSDESEERPQESLSAKIESSSSLPEQQITSHIPPIHHTHSFLSEKGPKVHSYQIADLEEVPHGIQRQSKSLADYSFPTHRLKERMTSPNKFPLVIVACGSFSPITYLHLRMFEMALDSVREQTRFEVIGAYFSPVSDNYRKPGLAHAHHRVRMCELACERTSSWLMVDAWESLQNKYTRTALVLDHFNEEINIKRHGVLSQDGTTRLGVKIMLLAGGDLIESMGEPNVWAEQDLHHILGNYGCLIVERTGSDVRSFLLSHDIMYEHRKNILVIKQLIYNDISSTKVRLFIRRNMSVQYLLPNSVIRYIQEHNLYVDEKEPVKVVLNK